MKTKVGDLLEYLEVGCRGFFKVSAIEQHEFKIKIHGSWIDEKTGDIIGNENDPFEADLLNDSSWRLAKRSGQTVCCGCEK
jgi:hypothetical protein